MPLVILLSPISGKWKVLLRMPGFTSCQPGAVYNLFAGEKHRNGVRYYRLILG
jgi:hypothetical protein